MAATSAWHISTRADLHTPNVDAERSFNRIRVMAGSLAMVFPFLLLLGDLWLHEGDWSVRDSLSAYYHSGVRDVFVGTLVATGMCLVAYRMASRGDARNGVSSVAGVLVIVVALLPTARPESGGRLTALQSKLGESEVSFAHGVSAFLFIGALCVMSYLFYLREKSRGRDEEHRLHRFGEGAHLACLVAMLVSCAWAGLNLVLEKGLDREPWHEDYILHGEWGAIWGFAISWLAQGFIHSRTHSGRVEPADGRTAEEQRTTL